MSKIKLAASIYAILMGVSLIGMWIMFYLSGNIAELATKPWEIGLHLTAEITTALLLIIGGYGLLAKHTWGFRMFLFSMGMLAYTLIMSPGYLLQKGDIPFAVMFLVFIIITKAFLIWAFTSPAAFEQPKA